VAVQQLRTLDGNMLWATLAASGTTEPFQLAAHGRYAIASTVTAVSGTTPSLQVFLDVQDAAGNWVQVAALAAQTAAGTQSGTGTNTATQGPQAKVARFRWTLSGTTPTATVILAAAGR
jgi:hypothetical protein